MKKRITYKDWTEIGKLNYAKKWLRPYCTYILIKKDDNIFERKQYVNLFLYCLIFIPVHIAEFFAVLWDGGLKEFMLLKRFLGADILSRGSHAFSRAEQIWENKKAVLK